MFAAILACLLEQEWTEPRIKELRITFDRGLLKTGTGSDRHVRISWIIRCPEVPVPLFNTT